MDLLSGYELAVILGSGIMGHLVLGTIGLHGFWFCSSPITAEMSGVGP